MPIAIGAFSISVRNRSSLARNASSFAAPPDPAVFVMKAAPPLRWLPPRYAADARNQVAPSSDALSRTSEGRRDEPLQLGEPAGDELELPHDTGVRKTLDRHEPAPVRS